MNRLSFFQQEGNEHSGQDISLINLGQGQES